MTLLSFKIAGQRRERRGVRFVRRRGELGAGVLRLSTLLLAVASGCFAPAASDWPQFRGPGSTGVAPATNVPVTLSTNVNLAWRAPLPGRGLSNPILVGDRVLVTCASGPRQDRLHVICLNAADGSRRWERQFVATGRTLCHEKTSVAAATPVSDGRRVLAVFSSGDAVCLDLDGNLLWTRALGLDYPNASNSLGLSSSPLAADGVFVVQLEADSDSRAFGFEPETGATRWMLERPRLANWTSPVPFTDAAGKAFVLLQSGKGVTAVEPAAGRVAWSYSDGASTVPSSVVHGGVVYVPSQGLTALEPQGDGQPPRQLWRAAQLRPGTPSPLVFDGHVFTMNDGGILTCGDVASGRRLWQLRLKGPMSASPVGAGRHLYCVNEAGLVQVIDPRGEEGTVACELDLGEVVLSTPAIREGSLYFRSDRSVWKFAGR